MKPWQTRMDNVSSHTDEWSPLPLDTPPHWEQIDFEDAFENIPLSRLKIPQKDYLSSGTIPIVDQGVNLIGGFTNDASKSIQSNRALIVFGDHTKCFKLVGFRFAPGADGVKVLKPTTIDERFAYYACRVLRLPDRGYSRHYAFLKKSKIPLAPQNEQRRIVAKIEKLFSELDKGIESLKTAHRQLEVYRQSVLKHAFEGKLTAPWREENKDKLETVEQLIERIPIPVQPRGGRAASADVIDGGAAMAVNIPVKAPPAGWSWVSLLRVARQETGHTPSRKHPEYWDGDQFWIGIADARLHHGKEIENTIQKVTPKGLDNSSARTLPSKTVCLSRTASVGYVCIMARPMATSQDFATWTCTEALEPKFLMYALMAEGNEIRRFGKGTTHTTIYFPEIRAMTICLPPLEEQRAIIDAVEAKLQQLDALAADIDSSLAHCDVLRRSILKKAFAGQLVAQNPNDEPASVLLDRIKVEKEQASKSREITKRTRKKRTVA